MEHPVIDLSNAKIGDEVEHFIHGVGMIVDINSPGTEMRVKVRFTNGLHHWYWADGRSDKNDMHPGIISPTPKKQKHTADVLVTAKIYRDNGGRLWFNLATNRDIHFNIMNHRLVDTIEITIPLEWEE